MKKIKDFINKKKRIKDLRIHIKRVERAVIWAAGIVEYWYGKTPEECPTVKAKYMDGSDMPGVMSYEDAMYMLHVDLEDLYEKTDELKKLGGWDNWKRR